MAAMAVVFWLAARDAPAVAAATGQSPPASLAVFRRSARAWALTLFYFLAFGGFVAMFLYLPKLLTGVYHLTKTDAGYRAAGFAFLAVLARPVEGGSLTGSDPSASFASRSWPRSRSRRSSPPPTSHIVPLTICCLAVAIALGLGTGAVFKLVAHWFPCEVGAVTGVVGAAGGLGGFFPLPRSVRICRDQRIFPHSKCRNLG